MAMLPWARIWPQSVEHRPSALGGRKGVDTLGHRPKVNDAMTPGVPDLGEASRVTSAADPVSAARAFRVGGPGPGGYPTGGRRELRRGEGLENVPPPLFAARLGLARRRRLPQPHHHQIAWRAD